MRREWIVGPIFDSYIEGEWGLLGQVVHLGHNQHAAHVYQGDQRVDLGSFPDAGEARKAVEARFQTQ